MPENIYFVKNKMYFKWFMKYWKHWFKLPGRTFWKIEKDSYFFSSFSLLAKAILNSFFFIPDPEFIWLITFEEKTTFLSKILEISIFKIAK